MKRILLLIIMVASFAMFGMMFDDGGGKIIDDSDVSANSMRIGMESALVQRKPEVVLLGNSMLGANIDQNLFSHLISKESLKISLGGSASAWWYLTMKNVIVRSKYKPETVVLFFRDDFLTIPGFRVNGIYKQRINDMRDSEGEALLDRLAYLDKLSQWQYMLLKHSRISRNHGKAKPAINEFINSKLVCPLVGDEPEDVSAAINRVFATENLNEQLLTTRQEAAEMVENDPDRQFAEKLEGSFLPEIVRLAKDNDIKLILMRVKRRRDLEAGKQPEHLLVYTRQLRDYCKDEGIEMLDFTDDERLKLEHYAGGDHLNKEIGRPLFTEMLAEKVRELVK